MLGDKALDRLLDLLACRPTGHRDAFSSGTPHITLAHVPEFTALLLRQRLQGTVVLDANADLVPVHRAMPGVTQGLCALLLLTGGDALRLHGSRGQDPGGRLRPLKRVIDPTGNAYPHPTWSYRHWPSAVLGWWTGHRMRTGRCSGRIIPPPTRPLPLHALLRTMCDTAVAAPYAFNWTSS